MGVLGWRARRLGWKVWFVQDSEFVHVGQGATAKTWGSPARAEMVGRADRAMLMRNMNPVKARASIAFTCAGVVGRMLVFGARRNKEATAALQGTLRGYLGRAPRPH